MLNKKLGSFYERQFMKLLAENGYWCHLFMAAFNGQPCDIIAIKNNVPYLIDVKHVRGDYFSHERIEDNQELCFRMALKRGNTNCGFALYFDSDKQFRYLAFDRDFKSAKRDELPLLKEVMFKDDGVNS